MINKIELEEKVEAYWISNVDWDWDKIDNKLQSLVTKRMITYHIIEGDEATDGVYWSIDKKIF